jgi:predicted CopG family antitoxin
MADNLEPTTIRVYEDTHEELRQLKVHDSESFDSVLTDLLESCERGAVRGNR